MGKTATSDITPEIPPETIVSTHHKGEFGGSYRTVDFLKSVTSSFPEHDH